MESTTTFGPDEKDELDEVVEQLGGEVQKSADGETIHKFPEDTIHEKSTDEEED